MWRIRRTLSIRCVHASHGAHGGALNLHLMHGCMDSMGFERRVRGEGHTVCGIGVDLWAFQVSILAQFSLYPFCAVHHGVENGTSNF